ncbi:MAG: hypothetical protein U9P71_03305 [Campylobacterota bacterium]|nr:hypothetical protein [Campylobacterota bacterium]
MVILRNILFTLIAALLFISIAVSIPVSHAYLFTKVASHYLNMNVTFTSPSITFNTYTIDATLEKNSTLQLSVHYEKFTDPEATLVFQGNLNIFSKVATVTLPNLPIKINAHYNKSNIVQSDANILDGTLEASFNLNDLSYHAVATNINISSYLNLEGLEPFAKGNLSLKSKGNFRTIADLNATLSSKDLLLLEPVLKYIPDVNASEVALFPHIRLTLKQNRLHSSMELNTSLAEIKVNQLYYHLKRGDFYLKLDAKNHMKAYAPVKKLHSKISGTYAKKHLLADIDLNIDGYHISLNDTNYSKEQIHANYRLRSPKSELLNIDRAGALYGELTYANKETNATVSSSYLNDIINVNFKNNNLHVNADTLSLDGILKHLKQEELNTTLHSTKAVGLNLHVINENNLITIKPEIISTLLTLHKSTIIYDTNHSMLHVDALLHDVNISSFSNPNITLKSDINLSKKATTTANIDFKLHSLVTGTLELQNREDTLTFSSYLNDINSSYYSTQSANITGTVEHTVPLKSDVSIKTPHENLTLKLRHDSNESHIDFIYALKELNRFAPLNSKYRLNGSGALNYAQKQLNITLNDSAFGTIFIDYNNANLTLRTGTFPLKEIFLLTNQKAVATGDIHLKSTITPTHVYATIDSKQITAADKNLSLRPTPLHLALELDTDNENYNGALKLTTKHEQLSLNPLEFSMVPLRFKSNFELQSEELSRGSLILPTHY